MNREDVWDIETSMLEREDCDPRAYGPETDRRGVCGSLWL